MSEPSSWTRVGQALGLVRSVTPEAPAESYAAQVTPPARTELGPVSPRESMGLDSVYRAMFILQTAVSQLTLDVWRRQAGDTLWTKLGGVNLDEDNEVSVNVLHFTQYALAW